ncbi:MAG: MoxR family ATPase, partial [Sphaerochaetaceae bacterium]|nr:MoxR family ATPase [Sphaerochaetaceae bacterium]
PKIDEEQHMLEVLGDEIPFDKVQIITNSKTLVEAQKEALNTYVSDEVSKYIVNLVNSTRLDKRLRLGASPRASRALYRAVKVWASMNGRDHVIPDDVQYLAHYVLDHRLVVENTARLSGIRAYDIVQDILDKTKCEPVLENIVSSN